MAPRSIPAGLSQMMKSNLVRSSAMIALTPSSVSASLSRVCEAGSSHRFSSRLSRISACDSLATPCTTLIRSNTTRRSAPRIRSRLRSPTSKSITTTFCPICASAAPKAAVVVVLPTPPLPDVTTKTFAIVNSLTLTCSIERRDLHDVAFEPGLGRAMAQFVADLVGGEVEAVDRQQFSLDLLAEDPRRAVAVDSGHRTAAQGPVDVDRAAGDDLRAGADRAQHRDVAFHEHDRLPGPHRRLDHHRGRLRLCLDQFLGRA